MRNRRSLGYAVRSVLMLALAAVVGMPFYYIVVNTLKSQSDYGHSPLALPTSLFIDNYARIFATQPVLTTLLNTLYVTVFSVALMLLVGSMAAYGMIMRNSRLNRLIGIALLLAFTVPFQSTLIPLYLIMARMKLVDSLNGLVVLYSAGSIFCYFLIQGYMKTVPFEIIEAARIDGCSTFGIFWRIVLPLIQPILVTVGVFQTMWVWNDFIIPNTFISTPERQTLVLLIYNAVGQYSVDWPAFMTMTVIVLAPVVVFFVAMQRHIINGLVAGSTKG